MILLYYKPCNSQNIYFNKTYDFFGNPEGASNVVPVDSGYLIVGFIRDSLNYRAVGILFIDTMGNEIWKKDYGIPGNNVYPGLVGSFVPTSDGGFALGGNVAYSNGDSDVMLWRFDSSGDTLWTKIYIDTSNLAVAYNCTQTRDGGFVLAGYSDEFPSNTMLMKTDSVGIAEWTQFYNGFGAVSVDTCYDGGYILGASNAANNNGYVIKTDSAGNMQWSKTFGGPYDENPLTVRATQDGGYILAGDTAIVPESIFEDSTQLYLIKLDSAGNTEWGKEYARVTIAASFTMVSELNDGSFIATGQTLHPKAVESFNGVLLKVNSQGDSLWYREYNYCTYSVDYFRDAQPTKDSGFIAVGFKNKCPTAQDMWVVKTNCLGFDAPPQPYFTDSITDVDSFIVNFTNTTKNADEVTFVFGDGDTLTVFNSTMIWPDTVTYVTHTYPDTGTYVVTAIAAACGDTGVFTDTVVISKPVGINDNIHNKVMMRCFPNPNSGQFTLGIDLQGETKLSIKLFHFTGQRIYSEEIDSVIGTYTQQMDLSEYSKGVYYLQVLTDNTLITQKIIVHQIISLSFGKSNLFAVIPAIGGWAQCVCCAEAIPQGAVAKN